MFDTEILLQDYMRLGYGKERNLLAETSELTRSKFIGFPRHSDRLTPVKPRELAQLSPRFSCFEFEHAKLHGFRLIEANNMYATDQSLVTDPDITTANFNDKARRGQIEELRYDPTAGFASASGRFHTSAISDALVLASDEPSNFGSWMFRVLAKFVLALDESASCPVFVYNGQEWMSSILKLVYPQVSIIPHNPALSYQLRNVLVPSLPSQSAYLRRELRERYNEIATKVLGEAKGHEKIYLSRRKQAIKRPSFRVLENETELVEGLLQQGYIELFPEDYPIATQISLVSQAKRIVCSGGSGLFTCLFARNAELIVDLEPGDTWQHAHLNVLSSTSAFFSMVTGVRNETGIGSHRNWTVDVAPFLEGLAFL